MGLLDRLFKPTTKALNRNLFSFLLNNQAPDMKGTDYLDAYSGWVYTCVNAIAEDVATIDLRLERKGRDGWQKVDDHIAIGPLREVNPYMSSTDLFLSAQSFLELAGESFWYLASGTLVKKPLEIWPLDPTRMTVVKNERTFVSGYIYKNEKGQDVPLSPREVIHFKRFNPRNRFRGMGTVQAAALAIDTDTYAAKWNRNFYYNSAVPGAVLETAGTLEQEQYERLKASWEAKYQGVDNSHKTAILEGGLTFKQAGLSQKDMEFLEQRRYSRDEIMGIFRVPKSILGITEDVNRANAEATEYIFAKRVVKPRMQFIADRLTEFYLPLFDLNPNEWRFHYTDPVPQNQELDLKRRETGIKNGYLTINEVRELDGMDPVKGGEIVYLPSTMAPLDAPARTADPTAMGPLPAPGKPSAKSISKEHAQIAGRVHFLTQTIKNAAPKYEAVFSQQKDALIKPLTGKSKAVKQLKDTDVPALERANELVRFLFADWNDWIGVLVNPTRETQEVALNYGGKQAIASLDLDTRFDQLNPLVLDWLNTFSLQHATSINDTVRDEVTLRLMEGVEAGKSADEIAASIGEFFDTQSQWRALRIARTEVVSAYAEGSLAGYRQSGIVKSKQWLTAGDERVDPECQMNQDQGAIALSNTFVTGHVAPPTHPNCRCVLQPVVD